MKIISGKADAKPLIAHALSTYASDGIDAFIATVHDTILKQKIRYPILEYVATAFYKHLPPAQHLKVTDRIIALKENGSDVIAGMMLQLKLGAHYEQSVKKAVAYIIEGSNWLSCDTIGERVLGYALLTTPAKTLKTLKQLARHDNNWVIRSIGVATHYAVKKGLGKTDTETMFQLLLTIASTTDFHTKKGVGWGAKTIAKFHPDLIKRYEQDIYGNEEIKQWFRSKIKIGLGRSFKYANRYTG